MPDHFHGVLYIKEELPKSWSLGKIIGAWKGACSRAYWRNTSSTRSIRSESLFEPGFHDRILHGKGQMQRWITYLHDNPRRLAIKREKPDLFRIHQQTSIRGVYCTTLGNMKAFLLHAFLRYSLQHVKSLQLCKTIWNVLFSYIGIIYFLLLCCVFGRASGSWRCPSRRL